MDCDLVYALDVASDTPRIIAASEMQSSLDALVTAGVADGTTSAAAHRKALRGRVVAETGTLACSLGGTMVFRQRGVDGRKPHFAHLASRPDSCKHVDGETSVPACPCGGRGGRGHLHMQAQKLIVERIAKIEFKHWCSKQLHQVAVRKDPGFTARVEQSARTASDRNVRLDVAVYKDDKFAFAVEVTHTHRVSPASREGIPYVDVNAAETVRRLQAGETTLLCESASGVPQCVACLTEDIKVKLKNFKWLLRCAHSIWKDKVREAFEKLAAEKRAEKEREHKGRLGIWYELQRIEQEAQDKEERRLEDQRESETKKKRARTFWGAFMEHSGAAQGGASKKEGVSATPKRQRVWESDKKREARYRVEHWEKMSSGSEAAANAGGGGSAPGFRRKRVCQACKNARTVLTEPRRGVNGGYGYLDQCNVCLNRMVNEGWGDGVAFLPEDDEVICELLNANGAPMFKGYSPSRMHFHKSVLAFHDALAHKKWEALVDHIRRDFTTTMSMPNAAMPGYRGWYRKAYA